jgi:hypothetical protein
MYIHWQSAPILKTIQILILILLCCACATHKPVELSVEQLHAKLAAGDLVKSGEQAEITTLDGRHYTLRVTAITASSVVGEETSAAARSLDKPVQECSDVARTCFEDDQSNSGVYTPTVAAQTVIPIDEIVAMQTIEANILVKTALVVGGIGVGYLLVAIPMALITAIVAAAL